MKPKTIEDLLERVKTWPPGAQGDLAQAVLDIEADIDRGAYGETYEPTPEEKAELERRIKEADEGKFVSKAEVEALFAKYRRP